MSDALAENNQMLDAPHAVVPVPRGPIPKAAQRPTSRLVEIQIDGNRVSVPEGATILDATRKVGIDIPTICFLESLTPVNVCRVCVVEMEGSRILVPACSRKVEQGMAIRTDSERVRLSRRLVLEFLNSSVDLATAPTLQRYIDRYGAHSERFGEDSAKVTQSIKVDNDLYVRDYSKCVLCYKCVEACGEDAQNTFAIAVAGRGFSAHIATEFDVDLPDSACVYCGNCIGVCPTGALMFKSEYDMRRAGTWDESRQNQTDTICPYCGVGCNLTVHEQDGQIVRVTSPVGNTVTRGNLCIKGRFGWQFVQIQPALQGRTRSNPSPDSKTPSHGMPPSNDTQ
jgi:predicted molibdopterin-dependent oxidoreductase YjgC